MSSSYDVVVVGGGAAGMSAAKILARMRRRVLMVDAGAPRNAPAGGVHNYLYAEGAAPAALAERGRDEVRAYGVDIVDGAAAGAETLHEPLPGAARFSVDVRADGGSVNTVRARRLLLATGLIDVLPDVEGLEHRWGLDVLHCPFCHGWEVRGRALGVLGTCAMSVHQALLFRQLSEDVVYFQHTAPDPTPQQHEQLAALDVQHVPGKVVGVEVTDGALSGVRMAAGRVIARSVLGIGTFLNGREDLLADLGLKLTDLEMGGVVVGRHLPCDASGATAAPGVWAAGNLVAPMAQVINSAAAGAVAGSSVLMDLVAEDVRVAVAERGRRSGSRSPKGDATLGGGQASTGITARPGWCADQ